ncbi:type I-E CRISPR-associated protein Cse1/CasA [Shewanella algae]|uniref:type I-E CRISPR-associated protein Cse1/CasA n=1 Tax=Shewanella algae TaxID=38313 RepID=UPI00313C4FCC
MNLINDAWIPAIRADGSTCQIAPWQLAETDNPVVELAAVRPDFQGALYQFLIGLLQTVVAPQDAEDWSDRYEDAPDAEQLKARFSQLAPAFELFSETVQAAFLQDLGLAEGEAKEIAGLLIEAPGGKTIKDNLDFFIKGGLIKQLCPACAAQALFTLQTNAPSGGVGHRVGLRGGGPLTTLLRPVGPSSLWQKLWLNVLDTSTGFKPPLEPLSADIFPWLGPTRLSDKGSTATFPQDVHALQMYWGMPRRIRLRPTEMACQCDLCGQNSQIGVTQFITRNYGVNYDGAWMHPLTPYRVDPKKEKIPLSLKGQKGGLGYRHWLGLTLADSDNGDQAAKVVQDFYEHKTYALSSKQQLQLWCFGYDMDNMKARCWYEQTMPVLQLASEHTTQMQELVQCLVNAARESAKLLRHHVKQAWYRRPQDVSGDISFIDAEFYHSTSVHFYNLLNDCLVAVQGQSLQRSEIFHVWHQQLQRTLARVFDQFTLNATPEDLDLKRVMQARASLFKSFNTNKQIKVIKPSKSTTKEAV